MPKYLIKASYTEQGVSGLLKEGGSGRRAEIAHMSEAAGGSLEAFYFAFGETDVYVIGEFPDNATAAAIALNVASSGSVTCTTTVLLTPEEIDAAAQHRISYRPPG